MAFLRIFSEANIQGGPMDVLLDGTEFTVGRDPSCSIQLADEGASRVHARLRRTASGWLLEDLGSSNGTRVRGVAIRTHQLLSGDQVQISNTRLEFVETTPPPLPEPRPKPARAPQKKWLLPWGLGALLVTLLLAILGGWLWSTASGNQGAQALKAAAGFRVSASQEPVAAFAGVMGEGLQGRVRELDEGLWPTVDPNLGWAQFFATSLVAAGKPRAGHRPILFYNPWADVGLVTVWTPQGRILDLQVIAGDSLRRGGQAPFGGKRGWLFQQAYGPTAVAGLTAQTLLAFEQLMAKGTWSQGLDGVCEAFRPGPPQTASRLACGVQGAEMIQELVAFAQPEDNPIRQGFVRVLLEAGGSWNQGSDAAKDTSPLLKTLKPQDWADFRPTACTEAGEKKLVMAQHLQWPDLFIGAVFRKNGSVWELERLDACSFQAFYGGLK